MESYDLYVSPLGSDQWTGREPDPQANGVDGPFATLERARAGARALAASSPGAEITVHVREGIYRFAQPLTFSRADSRVEGGRTVYTAYADESPVLSAGLPLTGWRPWRPGDGPVPAAVQDRVWVTDLPVHPGTGGLWSLRSLYWDGERLPMAASRGFLPRPVVSDDLSRFGRRVLRASGLPRDVLASDIYIRIRPRYQWVVNLLQAAVVDPDRDLLLTTAPGTYPLDPIQAHGTRFDGSCWLLNAVRDVDQPGEWAVDSRLGRVFLLPPDRGLDPGAHVTAAATAEVLKIDSDPGGAGEDVPPVRGLVFRGLTVTQTEWRPKAPNARGFQHDWTYEDETDGAIHFRGAADCTVEGCRVVACGGSGIRLDLHAWNILVQGNRIERVGGHGIVLAGFGPSFRDVNRENRILDNWISHCGRERAHSMGILVVQSGDNRIEHNLIHNTPFIGITLSGVRDFNRDGPRPDEGGRAVRWHEIPAEIADAWVAAYAAGVEPWEDTYPYLHARRNVIRANELFAGVEELGDGNAVYLSGAGDENLVEDNYIHHYLGTGVQMALRPDDLQKGVVFRRNTVYKCVFGAVEHKHTNLYENNAFVCIHPQTPWGLRWPEWAYILFGRGPYTGTAVRRNIFHALDGGTPFLRMRGYDGSPPVAPAFDGVEVDGNVYWTGHDPSSAREYLAACRRSGVEPNGYAGPVFIDAEAGDLRFRDDFPAAALGIEPLHPERAGLRAPWREHWFGGEPMRTRVVPEHATLDPVNGTEMDVVCDDPEARVHWTLDGTEPTLRSPLWTGPVRAVRPTVLRAKAFREGRVDLLGGLGFVLSPFAVDEDFETTPLGLPPLNCEVHDEQLGLVRVVDTTAASGTRSLCLEERSGLRHPFNPHLFYQPGVPVAGARARFDIRLGGEGVHAVHEWRDWSRNPYVSGPALRIRDGALRVEGTDRGFDLPLLTWIRIEIEVGAEQGQGWSLRVRVPGEPAIEVAGLPLSPGFQTVTWFGFSSWGEEDGLQWWLDSVRLERSNHDTPGR